MRQSALTIRRIEQKEKKGKRGAWRKEFCAKYLKLLGRIQRDTQESLTERLASEGKTISCRQGCTYCCYHYVAVSLAHGIVIVDYLYRRKELLRRFLDNFDAWHRQAFAVAEKIDQIRLKGLASGVPTARIITETRPISRHYVELNTPCPFLVDDRCSIYAVRPLACSGHYAVSPPECCAVSAPQEPVIHHLTPKDEDLGEMLGLAGAGPVLFELTLPEMIYRLLTAGSSAMMAEITKRGLA